MKEKMKAFFTKERLHKILMGCIWYALSLVCLWIFSLRAGGWTKQEWNKYFWILNLAWVVWIVYKKTIGAKKDKFLEDWEKKTAEEWVNAAEQRRAARNEEPEEEEEVPEEPKNRRELMKQIRAEKAAAEQQKSIAEQDNFSPFHYVNPETEENEKDGR